MGRGAGAVHPKASLAELSTKFDVLVFFHKNRNSKNESSDYSTNTILAFTFKLHG